MCNCRRRKCYCLNNPQNTNKNELETLCNNVPNVPQDKFNTNCGCGFEDEDNGFPSNPMYAQSYVPVQIMNETFMPCAGLHKGTIFPELVSEYCPRSIYGTNPIYHGYKCYKRRMQRMNEDVEYLENVENRITCSCTCKQDDSTREELMHQIKCYNFAVIELALYLDTHPNDERALCLHNSYCKTLKDLKDKYQKVYGPLSIYYPCNKWRWLEEPWPWEGGNI